MFSVLGNGVIGLNVVPITFLNESVEFFSAASITNFSQQIAVDNLVRGLKLNNLWNKMLAIYPFVGGTANSHKFNLKDPRDTDAAFRLSFSGTWTHSATGALPNSLNGYANTFLVPNTVLTLSSIHISKYNRNNRPSIDIRDGSATINGAVTSFIQWNYGFANGVLGSSSLDDGRIDWSNAIGSAGFFNLSRTATNSFKSFRNGLQLGNTKTSTITNLPTLPIFLGALNNIGTPTSFNGLEAAFVSIGTGLTDGEVRIFNNIVQNYQSQLNRQV